MINDRILEALEDVDNLIKEELKQYPGDLASEREGLRDARELVQEAITEILKG